jgi:N-acetylglucosaminyldiphosphoundecaprenol N-acetyl-beta-D-mannosaminyltransferase
VSTSSIQVNPQINQPCANVLGVGVHAIDLPRAVKILEDSIRGNRKGYVCVTGVHGVMEAQRYPNFRRILARALLVTPDGMPTVWVGKVQGHRQMRRVFGPDLMLEVCQQSVNKGFTHFLYGGKAGVAEQLQANLERLFPGIQVVGTYTPPFRALNSVEKQHLQCLLERLNPDIIWVGLSTPKQEIFMSENIDNLTCKLMIGVGAAFDIHTGTVNDAPAWIKQAGLQWLHRLCQEPARLWKRYLINNTSFIWRIVFQFFGLRHYDLPTETRTEA